MKTTLICALVLACAMLVTVDCGILNDAVKLLDSGVPDGDNLVGLISVNGGIGGSNIGPIDIGANVGIGGGACNTLVYTPCCHNGQLEPEGKPCSVNNNADLDGTCCRGVCASSITALAIGCQITTTTTTTTTQAPECTETNSGCRTTCVNGTVVDSPDGTDCGNDRQNTHCCKGVCLNEDEITAHGCEAPKCKRYYGPDNAYSNFYCCKNDVKSPDLTRCQGDGLVGMWCCNGMCGDRRSTNAAGCRVPECDETYNAPTTEQFRCDKCVNGTKVAFDNGKNCQYYLGLGIGYAEGKCLNRVCIDGNAYRLAQLFRAV